MTEVATLTVEDGDNSAQSLSMLMSSSIESPWHSNSHNPQITIDFDELVIILDVVLKPAFVIAETQSDFMQSSSSVKFRRMTLSNAGNVQLNDMIASFKNIRLVVKFFFNIF